MSRGEMSERKRRVLEGAERYTMPNRIAVWDRFGVPLSIGKREGYRIWDLDGHELIDLHINGGTFNLGHRNPEIVAALQEALAEVDIGNHHFPSEAAVQLAERLAELTPGELTYSVFSSSGSEAVDVAIKSARQATGRRKILAVDSAYHGRTGLSGAAGDDRSARYFHSDHGGDFATVPFDDLEALEQALSAGDVAALILETIPATSGFRIPSAGYLPGALSLCHQHGALYIADEVQTGFGRTGHLWGVESFGVEPDILVCGKALSGGVYPIAATVLSERAGAWIRENGWAHVSTFGGSELGCRVGLKALEITTREATRENVERLAARYRDGLAAIAADEPFLVGVRQRGLIFGLEYDHPNGGILMAKALYDRGVWAMYAGYDRAVSQWKPGLLMDEATCDRTLEVLREALSVAREVGAVRDAARAGRER